MNIDTNNINVEQKHSFHQKDHFLNEVSKSSNSSLDNQYSEKEKEEIAKLKETDQKVRTHENTHKVAAGQYARGGPSYNYETGPDNKKYAVGGEVNIDTSEVAGDPEATIQKAKQIRSAALAPAEPSSQDQKVAADASRMEAKARQEMLKEKDSKDNLAGSFSQKVKNTYSTTEKKSSFEISA